MFAFLSVVRFDECVGKLRPFLKQSGYKTKHVIWLPISALTGANVIVINVELFFATETWHFG